MHSPSMNLKPVKRAKKKYDRWKEMKTSEENMKIEKSHSL